MTDLAEAGEHLELLLGQRAHLAFVGAEVNDRCRPEPGEPHPDRPPTCIHSYTSGIVNGAYAHAHEGVEERGGRKGGGRWWIESLGTRPNIPVDIQTHPLTPYL